MRPLLSFAIAAILTSSATYAQEQEKHAAESPRTLVNFAIEGVLLPPAEEEGPMPHELIELFSYEESLSLLDLRAEGRLRITAHFEFPSVEDFQLWYNSKSTKRLFDSLQTESEDNLAFNLVVRQR